MMFCRTLQKVSSRTYNSVIQSTRCYARYEEDEEEQDVGYLPPIPKPIDSTTIAASFRPKKYRIIGGKQRRFIENNITERMEISRPEHWYKFTIQEVKRYGGAGILNKYDSIFHALDALYPEYLWQWWVFKEPLQKYFEEVRMARHFLERLALAQGYMTPYDWAQVTKDIVKRQGGQKLNEFYKGKLLNMCRTVFPEWDFYDSIFRGRDTIREKEIVNYPKPYPKEDEKPSQELIDYIKIAEKELGITSPEQWYWKTRSEIGKLEKGKEILKYHPGIFQLSNPDYLWEFACFSKADNGPKRHLYKHSVLLFKPYEVLDSYKFSITEKNTEVTVYIPKLKLVLDWQDRENYFEAQNGFRFGPKLVDALREQEKHGHLTKLGYTVVRIPFWWKGDIGSIQKTITHYRPDITWEEKIPESSEVLLDVPPMEAREPKERFYFTIPEFL